MLNEVKVGPAVAGDGSVVVARADRTGAAVVALVHGQYAESATRGAIMYAANAVAGVAPGTVLSTAPPLTLWNPPSSGKNLMVTKVSVGYVSGTLGAGCLALAANISQVTVPTGGTEITPTCSFLGMPRGIGRIFAASVLSAVPTLLRPVFNLGAFTATTPLAPQDCDVAVEGGIVLAPGTTLSIQGIAAAGTTPLVILGFTYEEVAI